MNNEQHPLIVITNDDGYEAPGLAALVESAKPFGEVIVVVPNGPRSAMSHAITMQQPLRLELYKTEDNVVYYRTNGTPVDCVKLAQRIVCKDRKIDLLLSGINHGSNASACVIYSGTMAAAIEASFENIPAIGFSLQDYAHHANFEAAAVYVKKLIPKVLNDGLPNNTCLNVNIPNIPLHEIKGMKVVRDAKGVWHEDFEERVDTFGRTYYWLTGYLQVLENDEDTCEISLQNGYVSIQPVQPEFTAYETIKSLKKWEE